MMLPALSHTRGKERDAFQALVNAPSRMNEQDKELLLNTAQGMARQGGEAVAARWFHRCVRYMLGWFAGAKSTLNHAAVQIAEEQEQSYV